MIAACCAVAGGGMIGGSARFVLAQRPGGVWGTWLANSLACLVLGVVTAAGGAGALVVLAAGTGFAGALSTWSTLAAELGARVRARRWASAAGYLAATVAAGVSLAGVGKLCGQLFF
ncbi:fluoride efflux transporter FluC [Corynebacterium sp. Marseille-Q2516]